MEINYLRLVYNVSFVRAAAKKYSLAGRTGKRFCKISRVLQKVHIVCVLITIGSLVFFSCASPPVQEPKPEPAVEPKPAVQPEPKVQSEPVLPPKTFLPLTEGWYIYDFERTFKGIENEYNFALDYGMQMEEEFILKQTRTITYYEEGCMYDPVLKEALSINAKGLIRGIENPSIIGTVFENGHFVWTGLVEQQGRLTSISVQGTLTLADRSARGGSEYDGVYHIIDAGAGREQVVTISDGFYTWRYLKANETEGFTPWPTLVQPDGSFKFETESATVVEIAESTKSHYATGFTVEGQVTPGNSISLQELSYSIGMGRDQNSRIPQVYTGTLVRTGEYPNEAAPADIQNTIRTYVQSAKKVQKIDWSTYPPWYENPPFKENHLYAIGEKTFRNREIAFAMAEAAAMANIAVQLRASIEHSTSANSGQKNQANSPVQMNGLEKIQVSNRVYDEKRGTAFVLLELDLNTIN